MEPVRWSPSVGSAPNTREWVSTEGSTLGIMCGREGGDLSCFIVFVLFYVCRVYVSRWSDDAPRGVGPNYSTLSTEIHHNLLRSNGLNVYYLFELVNPHVRSSCGFIFAFDV